MSAELKAGRASLRPSFQMIDRLYEMRGGQLVERDWYKQIKESWSVTDTNTGRVQVQETIESRQDKINRVLPLSDAQKTLSGAMNYVQRTDSQRYQEIMSEARDHISGQQEFSFIIW